MRTSRHHHRASGAFGLVTWIVVCIAVIVGFTVWLMQHLYYGDWVTTGTGGRVEGQQLSPLFDPSIAPAPPPPSPSVPFGEFGKQK